MIKIAILITVYLTSIAMLITCIRMIKGPSLPDRILAMDTLSVNGVALILLLDLWMDSRLYFGGAALIALLGFISTAAFCKYLIRGDIIE